VVTNLLHLDFSSLCGSFVHALQSTKPSLPYYILPYGKLLPSLRRYNNQIPGWQLDVWALGSTR
jgi:hypothetical protein